MHSLSFLHRSLLFPCAALLTTLALTAHAGESSPGHPSAVTSQPGALRGTVDLAVTQSFPDGTGAAADALFYDVVVTNQGRNTATNVTLDVPIPTGLWYFFYEAVAGEGSWGCSFGSDLHCDLGSLAPRERRTVHVTAIPFASGTFNSRASVASTEADTQPANNTHVLPIPVGPSTDLITFDTFEGDNVTFEGPHGPVNWGQGEWFIATPWGGFTTKSVSFDGPGKYQAQLSFLRPRRIISLDAFSWDPATLTLTCLDQPAQSFTLTPGQITHIVTGWQFTCTVVTVQTSNGWDTNIDNIELSPFP